MAPFSVARGPRIPDRDTEHIQFPYTQATLISMFHMRPLDDISALDAVEAGEEAPYPVCVRLPTTTPYSISCGNTPT